jgi:hypothetical protein
VFGPGGAQGDQSGDDGNTHSTASASLSSSDESSDGGGNQEGELTVQLIDFGRALSTYCTSTVDEVQQTHLLSELYGAQPPTQLSREVRYEGEVSCKGYQCLEMQRGDPWSYQVLCA